MIYRGQGFLAGVSFGSSHLTPLPPSPASKMSLFLSLSVYRELSLLTGEGGVKG